MALNTLYHYRVAEQPADYEVFQNHEPFESLNAESFNIYFCIHFAFINSNSRIFRLNDIPSLPSCQSITCERFFLEGPALLRRILSHPLIPSDTLEESIPTMMSDAQYFYDKYRLSYIGDPSSAAYPLAIDVVVEIEETDQHPLAVDVIGEIDEETEEEDVVERIMGEAMQEYQVRMIPASEEAIESLNTVKVEDNDDGAGGAGHCCICLEEYDEGAEVSVMPCHHVFHCDCIVQWLKTSHLCPLCRFEMPVLLDSNNS